MVPVGPQATAPLLDSTPQREITEGFATSRQGAIYNCGAKQPEFVSDEERIAAALLADGAGWPVAAFASRCLRRRPSSWIGGKFCSAVRRRLAGCAL